MSLCLLVERILFSNSTRQNPVDVPRRNADLPCTGSCLKSKYANHVFSSNWSKESWRKKKRRWKKTQNRNDASEKSKPSAKPQLMKANKRENYFHWNLKLSAFSGNSRRFCSFICVGEIFSQAMKILSSFVPWQFETFFRYHEKFWKNISHKMNFKLGTEKCHEKLNVLIFVTRLQF